jgi:argininosuccinate synthase
MKKIVLAYSGGLDTSVMLKWLKESYNAEIITLTANLGQHSDLSGLKEKALKTGASKAYVLDLKEEFVADYVQPSLKASMLYEGAYPLATALGRPLIAKYLVDVANKHGADTIAHGCTGKGNDQVRLELGISTLAPDINILAPLRDWPFKSREAEIEYAIRKGIPISSSKESPYSIDDNLWGVSTECGILEDITKAAPEDVFLITRSVENAVNKAEDISIEFKFGVPIALNGKKMKGVELISSLNKIAGAHAIGRIDLVENRVVGIKSREIYEAPAALVLHKAHYELEKIVLDKETFRYKQSLVHTLSNLAYDGLWFSPLRASLMAFIEQSQIPMSGSIKLKLYKGNMTVLSRESKYSLYSEGLATYAQGDEFNHDAAKGFIELYGLSQKNISNVYCKQNQKEVS